MPDWPVVQNAECVEFDGHMFLIALKNITHGEEITWSYSGCKENTSEDYWLSANHL
jgi:hypothetical protein